MSGCRLLPLVTALQMPMVNVGLVPKARNLGNAILNFMADSKEIVSAVRALGYDGSADKISLF
jgi:hypothetical protein